MTPSRFTSILIVDDSPESIALLGNSLPKQYKRQVALSGADALKLLDESEKAPDLILLDVIMPEMNGYELCNCIKKRARFKNIPIIIISSLNETVDKVKALKVGAVDFITKPFQTEEITARVEAHLEIAESRKEIAELYSKTLQGTIGVMNDIMAIVSPETAKISSDMRTIAEEITMALGFKNAWDFKLACQLATIGMLTEVKLTDQGDSQPFRRELEINKINEYLHLSTQVLDRIPRLEPVIKILSLSQLPLDEQYINKRIFMIEPIALKGHMLRILFHYFYKTKHENNHMSVLKQMRNDHEESYLVELLDILNTIQNKRFKNKILELELPHIISNMILVEDIITLEGRMLLKAGYKLSHSTITILKNYTELKGRKFKVINS